MNTAHTLKLIYSTVGLGPNRRTTVQIKHRWSHCAFLEKLENTDGPCFIHFCFLSGKNKVVYVAPWKERELWTKLFSWQRGVNLFFFSLGVQCGKVNFKRKGSQQCDTHAWVGLQYGGGCCLYCTGLQYYELHTYNYLHIQAIFLLFFICILGKWELLLGLFLLSAFRYFCHI